MLGYYIIYAHTQFKMIRKICDLKRFISYSDNL